MQALEEKFIVAAKASLTKDQVEASEQASFIEIIVALIPVLLPLILECFNSPERAARALNNPGPLQRRKLRKKCDDEFKDEDGDSREDRAANEKARKQLYNATLAAAKQMTAEDVKAMSAA